MNKTVLVTGGARGIGRGIAEKFAQNNYNIIINYNEKIFYTSFLFYLFLVMADASRTTCSRPG